MDNQQRHQQIILLMVATFGVALGGAMLSGDLPGWTGAVLIAWAVLLALYALNIGRAEKWRKDLGNKRGYRDRIRELANDVERLLDQDDEELLWRNYRRHYAEWIVVRNQDVAVYGISDGRLKRAEQAASREDLYLIVHALRDVAKRLDSLLMKIPLLAV